MMNLPTHDAGNWLIGFRVLRNLAGDKTLNTELRVWAAVNKAGHRGNKHLSLGRRFDMGQLTSLRMTAARVAQIQAAWSESDLAELQRAPGPGGPFRYTITRQIPPPIVCGFGI